MGLEQALFTLSVLVFGAQFLAWRWALGVERGLRGRPGHELSRVLTWAIGWSMVARLVSVGAIVVIASDHGNVEEAELLALTEQVVWAMLFLGAAQKIRQISLKRDADPAPTEGAESLEGVGVQVDQVRVLPAVAVDDAD